MAYYDALVAKWPTVTGATTADKLTALNAETVAGPRQLVPITSVMEYLRSNNLWLKIKAATGVSQGALAAVDYNSDARATSINFDLLIVKAMLADLVTNNLLSQDQSNALDAMANATQPWPQANGYPTITYGDLAMASLEGLTPWTHGPYVSSAPDASGNTQVSTTFWDTATPGTTYQIGPFTSNAPTQSALDNWASQVMRTQANRAALAKLIV